MNNDMEKKSFFKPQLSFDGVAIILSLIGMALWVGGLKATVEQHNSELADHEVRIRVNERDIIKLQGEEPDPRPTIFHSPKQTP